MSLTLLPAGRALLSRLRSLSSRFGQSHRLVAVTLAVTAALFVLAGVSTSYLAAPPGAAVSGHANSDALPHAGADAEALARLENYTRSIGSEETASAAPDGKLLPDVNTMIERLAARLKTTTPNDMEGWRMLGWSYFNTARYEEAATAYARAVELDPSSAELKLAYEQAKAKANGSENSQAASSLQTGAVGKSDDGPVVEKAAKSEAEPQHERDAVIRSMADDLADRLKGLPRNADGWTLLMRTRVVLGEREVAATALRAALEVFKDDPATSGKITAAAIELGLDYQMTRKALAE